MTCGTMLRHLLLTTALYAILIQNLDSKRPVDFGVCSYMHPITGYNKIYCLEEDRHYCCYSGVNKTSDDSRLHPSNLTDDGIGAHCCDFNELKDENYGLFLLITIMTVIDVILLVLLVVAIIAMIVLCCIKRDNSSQLSKSKSKSNSKEAKPKPKPKEKSKKTSDEDVDSDKKRSEGSVSKSMSKSTEEASTMKSDDVVVDEDVYNKTLKSPVDKESNDKKDVTKGANDDKKDVIKGSNDKKDEIKSSNHSTNENK